MEELTYLKFTDEFNNDVLIENQYTELYIEMVDNSIYLNEVQFKQLKEWIIKQEINTK